jgi:hypothetical protein
MKRFLKLTLAQLQLNWYLFWIGMWKGECAYTLWWYNKIVYLAACKWSDWNGTPQITQVFFDSTKASKK